MDDGLMTTAEAASLLRVTPQSLVNLRREGGGPRFIRIGRRTIRYSKGALSDWLASKEHGSTSEYQSS